MNTLKETLLSFYTRRLLKSNKTPRLNVGYDPAKTLGLIYTQGDVQKEAAILKLANQLKNTGKQVSVLVYLPKPLPPTQAIASPFPSFTNQAINYLGRYQDKFVAEFVHTPFDYLYHLDLDSHPVLDYLLARSQAKCRVGYFDEKRTKLYEVMVQPAFKPGTEPVQSLIEVMFHYTQLLAI